MNGGLLKELIKQFPNLVGLLVAIAVLLLIYQDMNMRFDNQFNMLMSCLSSVR